MHKSQMSDHQSFVLKYLVVYRHGSRRRPESGQVHRLFLKEGTTLSNPAGPHTASGSSLRWGRSPSISPGTTSTQTTPAGERRT